MKRGVVRKADLSFVSDNEGAKVKARTTLTNFDVAYKRALPGWINRILAKSSNHGRDFQTMRAYRRGLLRLERGRPRCTGASIITAVDTAGNVGRHTSITLGADGLPVISYYNVTNKTLKVAKCINVACVPFVQRR